MMATMGVGLNVCSAHKDMLEAFGVCVERFSMWVLKFGDFG
jgi:hypothetical protein